MAKRSHSDRENSLLKPAKLSRCIVFRVWLKLHLDNCTAKKTKIQKRPVAKIPKRERRDREAKKTIGLRIDEKIKLQRAQGGCPGTIRRRRTWQAAKSYGEPQAGTDP